MNNEPVAWRSHYPSGWEYKDGNPPFELGKNDEPLYTRPSKQLSDAEITAIWQRDECYQNAQAFARAIIEEITK